MLNILGFTFNYVDVVCFFAIYFLLATYFGNKLFYSSKMQSLEYIYAIICILAIIICINPLSTSKTILTSKNQIMLMLMLTTFLALTIQAITAKQQSVVLNVNNDTTCNHTTEATFINTHSRQNTFRFNSIERQEYENIYSNNDDLTQTSAVAGQDTVPSSISTQHSTKQEERLEHLQQQLSQLQQKFNDMTSKASEFTNATMHNQQSPQQITMIEDKIIILADKIHDIETQIVAKQQQDIDAIKHQLSQQEGNRGNSFERRLALYGRHGPAR